MTMLLLEKWVAQKRSRKNTTCSITYKIFNCGLTFLVILSLKVIEIVLIWY
jgi:hypothetical protein